MINPFFKNHGPFTIEKLLLLCEIDNLKNYYKVDVLDIKNLVNAEKNTIYIASILVHFPIQIDINLH